MKCADNAQSVRIQSGRNADDFGVCVQISTHLDPVSSHYRSPAVDDLLVIGQNSIT